MDEAEQERFKAAVERKKEEAKARSEQHPPTGDLPDGAGEEAKRLQAEQERELRRGTRTQGDARASNTGHGQKTADKWNQ